MNIKNMTSDELEKFSHLDIAYNLIKIEKKPQSTIDLLKQVCSLLNYGENEFQNLIGDFYTSLNVDKRFILIEGKWDLAENHAVKIIIDDEIDDDLEEYEDIDEEAEDEVAEIEDEAVLDDTEVLEDVEEDLDDDMDDLTILTEDEIEDDI